MRLNVTLFFLLFFFYTSYTQTANDFTIYNTRGDSVSLYEDYLDQGTTVVLDIFFTTCPPCNSIAPLLEPLYQDWGAGQHDVEFIALSNWSQDDNQDVLQYEITHGHTYAGAGADGGSLQAVAPYVNGTFGQFYGTPTFVVISPDGTVNFDVRGNSNQNTIEELDAAIAATGATGSDGSQPFIFPGQIKTFFDQDVSGAWVRIVDCDDINQASPPQYTDAYTNGAGRFSLELNEIPDSAACIDPWNNSNHGNGVSTFDIVILRRHLLNIEVLPTPLAMNSGDINNSGGISTLDIIFIRQVILNVVSEFPNNISWHFVPENDIMIGEDTPGPFDFIAYKVGDLNGSADPADVTGTTERSYSTRQISLPDKTLQANQTYQLPVFATDLTNIAGIQGSLGFDPNTVSVHGLVHGQLDIQPNAHTAMFEDHLTFSWDAVPAQKIIQDEPLFYVQVTPHQNVPVNAALSLNNHPTKAMIMDREGNIENLALDYVKPAQQNVSFYPNPTQNRLYFTLTEMPRGAYQIQLFASNGKLVRSERHLKEDYQSENLEWNIRALERGVYWCKISGPDGVVTEKIVLQ